MLHIILYYIALAICLLYNVTNKYYKFLFCIIFALFLHYYMLLVFMCAFRTSVAQAVLEVDNSL